MSYHIIFFFGVGGGSSAAYFSNFLFNLFFSVSLRCAPRLNMCVVTGSAVIDFFNRVHSITNRCTYSLIKPQGGSDFQLLAGFQERRQQNVMFLDHLILQLEEPDVVVYLGQGGLVEVRSIKDDSFYSPFISSDNQFYFIL